MEQCPHCRFTGHPCSEHGVPLEGAQHCGAMARTKNSFKKYLRSVAEDDIVSSFENPARPGELSSGINSKDSSNKRRQMRKDLHKLHSCLAKIGVGPSQSSVTPDSLSHLDASSRFRHCRAHSEAVRLGSFLPESHAETPMRMPPGLKRTAVSRLRSTGLCFSRGHAQSHSSSKSSPFCSQIEEFDGGCKDSDTSALAEQRCFSAPDLCWAPQAWEWEKVTQKAADMYRERSLAQKTAESMVELGQCAGFSLSNSRGKSRVGETSLMRRAVARIMPKSRDGFVQSDCSSKSSSRSTSTTSVKSSRTTSASRGLSAALHRRGAQLQQESSGSFNDSTFPDSTRVTELSMGECQDTAVKEIQEVPAERIHSIQPSGRPPSLLERRGARKLGLSISKMGVQCENQVEQALDGNYIRLEMLGSGSTSTVQLATRRSDGRLVVLKTMRSRDPGMIETARREFETMKKIRHPNIAQAIDFHVINGQAVLVLGYFQGRALDKVVRGSPGRKLPLPVAQRLAAQLFQALNCLQTHDVIHRDIKPENIIVSEDLQELRLVDFNSACTVDSSLTPAGTLLYSAPEVVMQEPSNQASDVWCAALCVFMMLSGRLPQRRDHQELSRQALEAVAKQEVSLEGEHWDNVPSICKDLLGRCLAVDQTKRPTIAEVIQDSWIAEQSVQYQ